MHALGQDLNSVGINGMEGLSTLHLCCISDLTASVRLLLELRANIQQRECDDGDDASVMENCVLRCASASCYDEVYGRDALEEGEVDTERGRAFRSCAREELRRLRGYQTFGTE